MKRDYGNVGTIVLRASALLQAMSQDTEEQKKEFNLTEYHQTYTQNAVAKLPKLSRRIVELMGDSGYRFTRSFSAARSAYFSLFCAGIRKLSVTDLLLPPHNATSRQHNMWCRIQLLMTLYVVSSP
ncbi:hypothetical protein A8M43_18900 [Escherichia coli]|uniref:hypothetical protein n=1 Tax=Escherichia coli TaxID=562 RepID=UPI000B6AF94B|nr:hypothetical protein [Escherichia coli]OWE14021.1 hypothetical protein A8M43_18900 [Escherichia coli]